MMTVALGDVHAGGARFIHSRVSVLPHVQVPWLRLAALRPLQPFGDESASLCALNLGDCSYFEAVTILEVIQRSTDFLAKKGVPRRGSRSSISWRMRSGCPA